MGNEVGRFCLPIKSANENLPCIMQNRPTLWADKIVQFYYPDSILNDKTFHRSTDFVHVTMVVVYSGRWIFIRVIYFVCYSIILIFVH